MGDGSVRLPRQAFPGLCCSGWLIAAMESCPTTRGRATMTFPHRGYPLGALFVFVTACAVLAAAVTPLIRMAQEGGGRSTDILDLCRQRCAAGRGPRRRPGTDAVPNGPGNCHGSRHWRSLGHRCRHHVAVIGPPNLDRSAGDDRRLGADCHRGHRDAAIFITIMLRVMCPKRSRKNGLVTRSVTATISVTRVWSAPSTID